jgi:hypothetical protein
VPVRHRSGFIDDLMAPMSDAERSALLSTADSTMGRQARHERDQSKAAQAEMGSLFATLPDQYEQALDSAFYIRAVLMVGTRASSYRCPHLQLGKAQPMFLAVGPPRSPVMCESCMLSYERSVGAEENRTCDRCGEVGDEVTWTMPMRLGSVMLSAGYCKPCLDLVQMWLDANSA